MAKIPLLEMTSRRLIRTGRSRWWVIVFSLLFLMAPFSSLTIGQPTLNEQIKNFRLRGYPSDMRPSEFTGKTSDGKAMSLAQFRGRVVLLNFFATWCSECRPEMPMFEKLHQEFASQGLAVLGINFREGKRTIRKYAEELGLTFPLVLDPNGQISRSYGVIGLPTTFLIARDGRPVALAIGPREWDGEKAKAIVRTLLAESDKR
ncbi:MAG: TlpA disulfide reductase family protein [Candidatus Binatia bacterium]